MHSHLFRRAALVLVAACGILCVSCGERGERLPETGATLEGSLTYGGNKVPAALVIVQGKDGSANGFVDEDGRFKIENVPLGEVNIAVNTEAGKGQMQSKIMAQSQGKPKAMPKMVDVPKKYFEPETSGLKTNVNKGPNTYDIAIPK
jgi:hypothetical protein